MEYRIKKNRGEAECLLRSYDGAPVVAYVADFDGDSAAVKPIAGEYLRPLWLRRDEIFSVNKQTIRRINEAYQAKDTNKLSTLWQGAELWQPIEAAQK